MTQGIAFLQHNSCCAVYPRAPQPAGSKPPRRSGRAADAGSDHPGPPLFPRTSPPSSPSGKPFWRFPVLTAYASDTLLLPDHKSAACPVLPTGKPSSRSSWEAYGNDSSNQPLFSSRDPFYRNIAVYKNRWLSCCPCSRS